MFDQSKRNTLKQVAAIGVGTAAAAVSSGVIAQGAGIHRSNAVSDVLSLNDSLAQINIGARLSSTTNELEVVLSNTSSKAVNMTAMTPAQVNTTRGHFDFNSLFKAGNVHLAPGESITVPMQHHAVVLDGSSMEERAMELTQSLRRSVSIITDGNSFAATTVVGMANFA